MKKWLIIFGVLIIIIISGYLGFSFFAVRIIQGQLQKFLGTGLSINKIKIRLTYLSLNGIKYENLGLKKIFFNIEEIKVYPNIKSIFKKPLTINKISIIKPNLSIYRSKEGIIFFPLPDIKERKSIKAKGEKEETFRIYLKNILLEDGKIYFEDEKAPIPPAKIRFEGLNLNIKNIDYPTLSENSPIFLKTNIIGREKVGIIETKGLIDFGRMNLKTELMVRDVEIKLFEPYYRKRVSADIEKGFINMSAKIFIKDRIIDAPGEMEILDLKIKESGTIFYIPAKILISRLKDKENKIRLKFRVNGNIDDPKFNITENLLTKIALSMSEALGVPIKIVGEKIIEGSGISAEKLIEGIRKIEELFKVKK